MADRYLLESGAPDGYLLEDGTGVLLLEAAPPPDPVPTENAWLNTFRLSRNATEPFSPWI